MKNNSAKIIKYIYAVATLSGTIIGVGFFSLPFLTAKVGLGLMLLYFLVLGAMVLIIHLFFGELALKTPDFLRFISFAQLYLGKWGKKIAMISTIFGLFGAILAYLIIGGEFLKNFLSPFFGGNILFYTGLYFLAGAVIIFFGFKAVAKIEFWGLILFLLALAFIFLKGLPFIKLENLLVNTGGRLDYFLPYGPVLFSLWGISIIPEIEEMLGRDKKRLKKIITISLLIPLVVYLLFIFLVVGISGPVTTEEAIIGLKDFFGRGLIDLLFLFGVLTTFTSFIALGLILKKILHYDLKVTKNLAWVLTCFVPLLLFLLGFKNFIQVIGLVGGVMLAIDGILIILMYNRIKNPRWRFFTYPLVLILVLGIVYEIYYFIK